jgi:hypothetical protein
MRPIRLRFTLRTLLLFVAVVAAAAFALRAWRRQVYCLGWAGVWEMNAESMRKEGIAAAAAHQRDRAKSCEVEAAKYIALKHEYERAAYRFWEPIPAGSPRPPELR